MKNKKNFDDDQSDLYYHPFHKIGFKHDVANKAVKNCVCY
jgi:hypothetical protein